MLTLIRQAYALAVFFGITASLPAADEPLSRGQIVKAGKAATAMVVVKEGKFPVMVGNNYASAFCIHSSGLFLTNEHVVRKPAWMTDIPQRRLPSFPGGLEPPPLPKQEITLILNPGQQTEKSYPARVLRSDQKLDLALLRIDGVKDLPTLSLGTDEGLEELMEIVAFGFPFSDLQTRLFQGPGPRENPAVSVNTGKITALRQKGGQLDRIQLDAAINPGNSGGPVLDKKGKVVGVVASSLRVGPGVGGATGVNYAIPVSHVNRFLAQPDVQFSPPKLEVANIYKPVPFEARVVSFVPAQAATSVDLILKSPSGKEQTYHMQADGDNYRVAAVPVPPPTGAYPLRLVAQFDNGTLNATAIDRAFKVGDREVKLSEVREVRPGSKPQIVLQDGKTVDGALSGLEAVPIRLGDQTLAVNLAKAAEVKFGPAAETDHVYYSLLVRQGDKEVFRQSDSLTIHGLLPVVIAGKAFAFIDLQAKANYQLKGEKGDQGSNLATLPTGRQTFADVPFQVGPAMIQLALPNLPDLHLPDKVEGIRIDRRFARLHLLHATHQAAANDTPIGEYTVTWADGAIAPIPIRYGKDMLDWWYNDRSPEPTGAKVAWRGDLPKLSGQKIRLYVTTWENPKPDIEVKTITFVKMPGTRCAPFCVAMTAEGK